ncbi:MAG: hypothetical protein DRQ55_04575 [Planctomycetota bacterium]|nr:MAG: hypothetical protein DRQ55_04575 [Planctomycetota bacterium]
MPLRPRLRSRGAALLAGLTLLSLLPVASVSAQTYPVESIGPPKPVPAPDPAPLEAFAGGLASGGQTIAVGSPAADGLRGKVELLDRSGDSFQLVDTLAPASLPARAGFGGAIELDGDTLAVGAPNPHYPSSSPGAVWIFVRSGGAFVFQQELVPASALLGDQFGRSLALDGERLLVGAPFDDDLGAQSGSAFVFERVGEVWTETAQLLPNDGASGDQFGRSVALSGDTALVGAWLSDAATDDDDAPVSDAGAAYVFVTEDDVLWSQQAQLLDEAEPEPSDHMGQSVGLHEDHALVGAPRDDMLADDTGVVHHFARAADTWSLTRTFQELGVTPGGQFGSSMSSVNNLLLVGSPYSGINAKGRAIVFERDDQGDYSQIKKLESFLVPDQSHFGTTVAAGSSHLLFGAPTADGAASDGGALLNSPLSLSGNWISLGKALAGTNGEPVLSGTGTIIMDEPFELSMSNGLPNSSVAMIMGFTEVCAPFKGGFLVPSTDFIFYDLITDGTGSMTLGGDWPTGFSGPWDAVFQVWFPDPGAVHGFAASNGLLGEVPPG